MMVQNKNNIEPSRGCTVARNKVQFQKGLSEVEFERLYGMEELCRAALEKWRWPNGFVCPACDGRKHHFINTRGLYQCTECRHQVSLTAGMIFASTKLALKTWFHAMYHVTQTKQAISSLELGRRLGVTQTTAWKLKHKLAQVMMERDATKRLVGLIEMDDAYLGGERTGGKRGRGSPGKTPIIVAVETTPQGKPARLKMRRIKRLKRKRIKTLASRMLARETIVLTDGLRCFRGVADAGSTHLPIRTGSGRRAARHPAFKWANTVLGNIKTSLTATYRGISAKHVPRYLAEFEYRFNRRFDLTAIIPRLAWASVRTAPMPYSLLKLAEDHA